MIVKSNYIIIGSTGRNTGETEFACRLIQKYSINYDIYGVKVVTINRNDENCPRGGRGCGVCTSLIGNYDIVEETVIDPGKDTSRMLIAGAKKVFLLKVDEDKLELGLIALQKIIPENALVVIESNSLRKVLAPALFIVIQNKNQNIIKKSCCEVIEFADKIVEYDGTGWNFNPERVLVKNNTWLISENSTAIILAGGRSSRMGGEDKSMLPINGVPLIQHIVNQLKGHFDSIIIGSNNPSIYSFLNLEVVPDVEQGKGPLMGIYSCLLASPNDINFITACDIPEMNIGFIKNMIDLVEDCDIVMPVTGNNCYEPLYAVYKKTVLNCALETLARESRRIVDLLSLANTKFVEFKPEEWYRNINSKNDYLAFLKSLNERAM